MNRFTDAVRIGVTFFLLAAAGSASAQSWWNDEWDYRKEFLFDMTPAGAAAEENIENAVVLLRLSSANFPYFANMAEDGSDMRVIGGDDATPLAFYIEKFDPVNEIALIWVRIPRLSVTDINAAFLYYGNDEAVSGGDPGAVFDPETRLILDFPAVAPNTDRTAFGNDPVVNSAAPVEAGVAARAASFADPAAAIRLPPSPGLEIDPEAGFTASWFLRVPATQEDAALLRLRNGDGVDAVTVGLRGGLLYANFDDGIAPFELAAATIPIVADQWFHVAITVGVRESQLLVNGDIVARGATPQARIGGQWTLGGADSAFAGDIDQFAVYATDLSVSEVRFAARSAAPFSNVVLAGDDARNEGASEPNYFATTMRNVTTDGWVVIVILAVMFVISVWVMAMKARLLSRVEKQNNQFLERYRRLKGDPIALDRGVEHFDTHEKEGVLDAAAEDNKSFHPSTLFPLYHAGAVEVKKRLAERSPSIGAQASNFSAETISAIGASIDAAFVRQRQKLNSLMVLLTIAISGGPFLGLLGTVVGVMITFAAIAESGDVNVNSIAPGIAAALVATVAGLAVAIPALFGYNWLGARIKDIDANTQVFADEYINRIAEHYV